MKVRSLTIVVILLMEPLRADILIKRLIYLLINIIGIALNAICVIELFQFRKPDIGISGDIGIRKVMP